MKQIRNTVQRDTILQTVIEMVGQHPTAEEVYFEVIKKNPHISKGTVYRNLNILCDLGSVLKVALDNGADRFDYVIKHHAHFECRQCHQVFDVELPPVMFPQASRQEGFVFEGDSVLFKGLCPRCAKKKKEEN